MAWNILLSSLENDPWGLPYKAVTQKLTKPGSEVLSTMAPYKIRNIVQELFPTDTVRPALIRGTAQENPPIVLFSVEELETVVNNIARRRVPSPGPDGIIASILITAIRTVPSVFLNIINHCYESHIYPTVWKRARLVLLRKPNKDGDEANCFRPICLLNELSKLFERLIKIRMQDHMRDMNNGLSDNRFGFRQGRSCLNAMSRVRSIIQQEGPNNYKTCAVGLDIANAFNCLPWDTIIRTLKERRFPVHLIALLENYFYNREFVWISSTATFTRHQVRRGVPQGSILGPILWNICFDGIMNI